MEGRVISTSYIPGAFLQNCYDKGYTLINMDGEMVTLLKYVEPAYYKDFIYLYIRGDIFINS